MQSPKARHCKSQTQDVESAPTAPTRCLTLTSYHILHLDSCPNTVTIDGAGAYTVFFQLFMGDDFPTVAGSGQPVTHIIYIKLSSTLNLTTKKIAKKF